MDKNRRIKKEIRELRKEFSQIDDIHSGIARRLIERAAYQKVTLEDLEKDLDENGMVEMFQQGKNNDPYERRRPNADLYVSISAQYQRTLKQLNAMLPKDTGENREKDDLMDFLNDET